MSDRFDDLDERHDDQCEGDGGGMLNCSCGPRQQQRVLAELHALRAATPSSGVTEGKAESGERIPGRDFCPLDGEPLWLRIQSGGKPQLYIHADRLTWHTDVTDKIRTAAWESPFTAEAPGSPEAMLREIFAAQPPAPADEAASVESGELLDLLRDLVAWNFNEGRWANDDTTGGAGHALWLRAREAVERDDDPIDVGPDPQPVNRELIEHLRTVKVVKDEPDLSAYYESLNEPPAPNEQCESVVRLARRSSEREWAPIPRDELLAELRTLRRQKQMLLDYCAFVDDQNAKDSRRTLHTRIIRRQLGEPDAPGARDEENTDG